MKFKLRKPNDITEFAKHLNKVFLDLGYTEKAQVLDEFCSTCYTTSSEFLGEFKIILKGLIRENVLEEGIKSEVNLVIEAIDKAYYIR